MQPDGTIISDRRHFISNPPPHPRLATAHVALAFQGAGWTSEYTFPLMVMQSILGSWDRTSGSGRNIASKFGQEVAEHELAHSFMTFNTAYKDTGLFGIYAVAPDNKLEDLMWYMTSNLVRIVHKTTDEEVRKREERSAELSGLFIKKEDQNSF